MTKKSVSIGDWSIIAVYWTTSYAGPSHHLTGVVLNHPGINNGHRVLTTKIIRYDSTRGRIETLNTCYLLNEPLPAATVSQDEINRILDFMAEFSISEDRVRFSATLLPFG